MKNILAILGAAGAGAALMYLYDPKGGNRRRAMIRDKAVALSNDVRGSVQARTKDLSNRAQGLLHEAKSMAAGTSGTENYEQAERMA